MGVLSWGNNLKQFNVFGGSQEENVSNKKNPQARPTVA